MVEVYEMIFDACGGDYDEMERVVSYGKAKLAELPDGLLKKCFSNSLNYCENRIITDREIDEDNELDEDDDDDE